MDRALSDAVKQKRKRSRILQITIYSLVFLFAILSLRFVIKPSVEAGEIRTAKAGTGDVEASVSASGIVSPEFEEVIISPVQSRIIYIYNNTGDQVKNGDSILLLDRKNIQLSYEKLKDELNIKKNNINQLRLRLEKSLIDLKTQYEIKKLQVENMEAELEEEKYLNEIGGSTKEKIEKAGLNLKISRLELEQIRQNIRNQEESMQAELLGLNYEISIQQKNVNDLLDKLNNTCIIADKGGVITWINDQIGKNVNQGEELVKIANLQSYEVIGSISDMYADKLSSSGKVIIRVNDDIDIKGEIISISPAVSGNIVNFKIKLIQKNHPLLRPNLKVDVSVVTSYKENVVRVQNGPFYQGATSQVVFIVEGNELVSRKVTFGESNFDYVEIVSGIEDGEEVVVSDLSDREKQKKIRLKY